MLSIVLKDLFIEKEIEAFNPEYTSDGFIGITVTFSLQHNKVSFL